jgi:hypothetical protein
MNPKPVIKSGKVPDPRMMACKHMKDCFDFALESGWSGVSCAECGDFKQHSISMSEILDVLIDCLLNRDGWPVLYKPARLALSWMFIDAHEANPVLSFGPRDRRLDDCKHYARCLAAVVSCDWPDFTCKNCQSYEKRYMTIFKRKCEQQNIFELWAAAYEVEGTPIA